MKCEDVEPEEIPDVTVVFCGVVDYASLSRTMAPQKVHSMLQRLFKKLDNLVGECQMYKVETVGDELCAPPAVLG